MLAEGGERPGLPAGLSPEPDGGRLPAPIFASGAPCSAVGADATPLEPAYPRRCPLSIFDHKIWGSPQNGPCLLLC